MMYCAYPFKLSALFALIFAIVGCDGVFEDVNPSFNNTIVAGAPLVNESVVNEPVVNVPVVNEQVVNVPVVNEPVQIAAALQQPPRLPDSIDISRVRKIGEVLVRPDLLEAEAIFLNHTAGTPSEESVSLYSPYADYCQFINSETIVDATGSIISTTLFIPDVQVETIDAGETITFTAPSGTFTELVSNDVSGAILYGLPNNSLLPSLVPDGTEIGVLGNDFPSFTNVPVPIAPPISNYRLSSGDTYTPEASIIWDASNTGQSAVHFYAVYNQNVDTSDPTQTVHSALEIDCSVVDDGDFTLPEDILSVIPENAELSLVSLSRVGRTVIQKDDALLFVYVQSESLPER